MAFITVIKKPTANKGDCFGHISAEEGNFTDRFGQLVEK